MRNGVISPNLRNRPIMHHLILDEMILQTKHSLYYLCEESCCLWSLCRYCMFGQKDNWNIKVFGYPIVLRAHWGCSTGSLNWHCWCRCSTGSLNWYCWCRCKWQRLKDPSQPWRLSRLIYTTRFGNDWFNDLMVCCIEKELFKSIDEAAILQRFQNIKTRRMQLPRS